ncbi:MAG: hypothetical protein GX569_01520 [Candidatus Riflebacteria bacterium]|nr:hypothetical protein [Candidatus Riflebacteria bacterium]
MRKRLLMILLLIMVFIGLYSAARIYFGALQLHNPSYMWWIMTNKACNAEYLHRFVLKDTHNSRLVKGLSVDQIRRRFPMLCDADSYASDSYRGEVLEYWRSNFYKGRKLKMLWFDEHDGSGWVVVVVDGTGYEIRLMKG